MAEDPQDERPEPIIRAEQLAQQSRTFDWNGQTRYKCPVTRCKFDGYSRRVIKKHLLDCHLKEISHAEPEAIPADPEPVVIADAEPIAIPADAELATPKIRAKGGRPPNQPIDGGKVRELRGEKLSQPAFADKLGLSTRAVADAEKGLASEATLLKLCRFAREHRKLELTPADFKW